MKSLSKPQTSSSDDAILSPSQPLPPHVCRRKAGLGSQGAKDLPIANFEHDDGGLRMIKGQPVQVVEGDMLTHRQKWLARLSKESR
jgi:hypothetical protein